MDPFDRQSIESMNDGTDGVSGFDFAPEQEDSEYDKECDQINSAHVFQQEMADHVSTEQEVRLACRLQTVCDWLREQDVLP
jgi:hypothetical protein